MVASHSIQPPQHYKYRTEKEKVSTVSTVGREEEEKKEKERKRGMRKNNHPDQNTTHDPLT
jgi:hypothetical protein